MKIKYQLEEIGHIDATLTITATLDEWEVIDKQISNNSNSWRLGAAIQEMLEKARKAYAAEGEY